MRVLVLSLTPMFAAAWQPSDQLALHDPPQFKKGQIQTATDAGAHSAPLGAPAPAPSSVQPTAVELKLRQNQADQPASFQTNFALGSYLLEAGRPDEAISWLESAIRQEPKSIPARHDLSVALMEQGKLVQAESLLRELQKETTDASVIHLEAKWLAASGKPVEAADKFQRAAEAEPTESHLFDWGNHMLAHGAAEPAGRIFAYAAGKYPKSARLKVAQGVSWYAQGEYDQAVRMLCEGIRLNPQDLRPLVFLGQMIGVAPQHEQEIHSELQRFARLYPKNAQAQYFYGLSLLTLKDSRNAETYLRRAAVLDPEMPQPHVELGKLYADVGLNDKAILELRTAVRLAPEISTAHYKLAQLYRRAGQASLAENHFAVWRKLRAEQSAREDAERRRRTGLTARQ